MRKVFLLLILYFTLIISCTKNKQNSNYNYTVNTTNPVLLPIGTLVADINGVKNYFDSAILVNIVYYPSNPDTAYEIGISGFNHQSAEKYSSFNISLRGWLPLDTASYYNYNNSGGSNQNLYGVGYYIYDGALFNSYSIENGTVPLYLARITYVDDTTLKGVFSGYISPYNVTNGAFNLKANIPSSFIR